MNCPFYFRIGACRNGDRCNRIHNKPNIAQTLLIPHIYPNIQESLSVSNDEDWDDETYAKAQEHAEFFFEEVFLELANYGEVEDMVICDNVSEHMIGNVYVKFFTEEAAKRCHDKLPNRFYGGTLLQPEFSPVANFSEARCRAFHETRCARGGLCNFMHIKHIPKAVKRRVMREMYEEHPDFAPNSGSRAWSRSRSPARKKKLKRQSSEERKALIAQWNKERFTGPTMPTGIMLPPPPVAAPVVAAA